jgi:hypothetical protein
MKKYIPLVSLFLISIFLFSIIFVSALTVNIPTNILTGNGSLINTNDSYFLRGLTPNQVANLFVETDPVFGTWLGTNVYCHSDGTNCVSYIDTWALNYTKYINSSQIASTYLNLSGTNANQNINIGNYNFTTTGTLKSGVTTITGNNGNNYYTLLNLNNTAVPASTNMLQSADIVLSLTQSVGGVSSLHPAGRIRAYKYSDWFHATTEADTDSGLTFFYTKDGTETLGLTLSPENNLIVGGSTGTGSIYATNLYLSGTFSPDEIYLTSEKIINFEGSTYMYSESEQSHIAIITGTLDIGDGTNIVNFNSNGDMSFEGTAGFYPIRISQSSQPTSGTGATEIDTGEMIIWRDSDDGKVYYVYNDATSGIKKVELT